MLRVDRSTIPTGPMPSLASPYLVRQSLSVALSAPVSLEVRKGLRVVFRPSPAFQLQSILLSVVATMAGVLLLLHPAAFSTFPFVNTTKQAEASLVQTGTLPSAGLKPISPSPAHGAVLGHIQIARLHMDALVREGTDKSILQTAIGHVPQTGAAEEPGNFALAGHRETFFSSLRAVRPGDSISFSKGRETYHYRVFSTRIVKETDISVLKPDGGFESKTQGTAREHNPHLLTLITCYPFTLYKKATERFIVQADLQSVGAAETHLQPSLTAVSTRSGKRLNLLATRTSKTRRTSSALHRHEAIARSGDVAALVDGK